MYYLTLTASTIPTFLPLFLPYLLTLATSNSSMLNLYSPLQGNLKKLTSANRSFGSIVNAHRSFKTRPSLAIYTPISTVSQLSLLFPLGCWNSSIPHACGLIFSSSSVHIHLSGQFVSNVSWIQPNLQIFPWRTISRVPHPHFNCHHFILLFFNFIFIFNVIFKYF